MSLAFDSTTDRLTFGTVAMPVTGSLAFWVRPTWAQADNADHFLYDCTTDASNIFRMQKYSDNSLYCGWYTAGDYRVAVTTANYTLNQNAWNLFVITWDDTANVSKLYLNGSQIGSSTSTLVTHTTTAVKTIGNYTSGAGNVNAAASFAEFAMWNAVLDANEVTSLFKAFAPSLVRLSALIQYGDLIRNPTAIKGTAFVDTTTSVDVHPRIYNPTRPKAAKAPTTSGFLLKMMIHGLFAGGRR